MIYKGNVIPIIYFYKNGEYGEVAWDYALPDELEKTKYGIQEKKVRND